MKMGRPKLENARTKQYRLRLNDEEYERLMDLSEKSGKSVSDILRFGVDLLRNFYDFSGQTDIQKGGKLQDEDRN